MTRVIVRLLAYAMSLSLAQARMSEVIDTTKDGRAGSVGEKEITNSIGMKLTLIPSGEFLMGSPDDDEDAYTNEKPKHIVRLTRSFYLGIREVTQAQYEAVMGNNPSKYSANGDGKENVAGQATDRHPVERVSWLDAVKFCNKLSEKEGIKPFYEVDGDKVRVPDWSGPGYRLPTEAEWEYACRANAPTETRYSFGDDAASLGEFAWYGSNSGGTTHQVGEKHANRFGLFDMHGNVWEWCWDGPGAYKDSQANDPRLDETGGGIIRGGGFYVDARDARSARRLLFPPESRSPYLGFRCARVQAE